MQTPDADPATSPVDADGVSAVAAGTVLWAIGGVILVLFFRTPLADADASWWLWVPLVGTVLGLIGLPYTIRRRSAYRAAASTAADKGPSRS